MSTVSTMPAAAGQAANVREDDIRSFLRQAVATHKQWPVDDVDTDVPFASLGLGSLDVVRLAARLQNWLGREVPPTLLWDHPSIDAISHALCPPTSTAQGVFASGSTMNGAASTPDASIGVIGMACRFPGADTLDAFWALLLEGRHTTRLIAPTRWPAEPDQEVACLLDRIDGFDPAFFGILAAEATRMDPQQRLLLEVSWEALENAGIRPGDLQGSRTGVFVGISSFDYGHTRTTAPAQTDVYAAAGTAHSIAANRLSYVLNLRGPSVAVDTACSSSLVALHLAARSLEQGDCDLAIVGGVNLLIDPSVHRAFRAAGMLAPDGRCKAYDDAADGYVRGEGCGVVILRRMAASDAQAVEETPPLAWLRATAINQDGRSNGLFAPNGEAQVAVIQQALARAGLAPQDVAYLEGHGTGTRLGDAIEIGAMQRALGRDREALPVVVGSVKPNIGHLEAAAGIAGFIKTVLVLQHRTAPPLRLMGEPNRVGAEAPGLVFIRERQPLQPQTGGLHAAVSSFGFGGTNAHAVLKAASRPAKRVPVKSPLSRLWLLSARDEQGLQRTATQLHALLSSGKATAHDIGYSLAVTREPMSCRVALHASDDASLGEQLSHLAYGKEPVGRIVREGRKARRIAWQFTGQGGLWPAMARDWYAFSPVFRRALDEVCAIAARYTAAPLLDVLLQDHDASRATLEATSVAQPALFCVEWAWSACMLQWFGGPPAVMTGHSLGFYAAACRAGAFSLEDAVRLVCERGACFEAIRGAGQALVVFAPENAVRAALGDLWDEIDVAARNAEDQLLLACATHATPICLERLAAAKLQARVFNEAYAFHSRHAVPGIEAYAECLTRVQYLPTTVDLVCDRTGELLPAGTVLGPSHWLAHAREPVRFDLVHQRLAAMAPDLLLEIGPGSALSGLAKQNGIGRVPLAGAPRSKHEQACASTHVAALLPRKQPAWDALLGTIGDLFERGIELDWRSFGRQFGWRRVPLPNYPFSRERHWMPGRHEGDAAPAAAASFSHSPSLAKGHSMSGHTMSEPYIEALTCELSRMLRIPSDKLDPDASLLDMGVDSLILMGAVEFLQAQYGVSVHVSEFFTRLTSIRLIAEHLVSCRADTPPAHESPAAPASSANTAGIQPEAASHRDVGRSAAGHLAAPARLSTHLLAEPQADLRARLPAIPGGSASPEGWQRLFEMQLETVSRIVTQQLHAVQSGQVALEASGANGSSDATVLAPVAPTPALADVPAVSASRVPERHQAKANVAAQPAPPANASAQFMPFRPGQERLKAERNARQAEYLDRFMRAYNARTHQSKAYAEQHRPHLSDNRMVSGFRLGTKPLVYPIVSSRAQGAHIWDLDGNRYLDITMGFGVALFGHNAPFLAEAVAGGVSDGYSLGPQCDLAGEVASLLCEITGHERASFANTGSEAIMLALRLARAETGRPCVVVFSGSYHGNADAVMARMGASGALPFAPGITQNQIEDLYILEYGTQESLDFIRHHAHRIAAVLVEPVQSRNPEFQPRDFLLELRRITQQTGVALIFDEVLNGFRIHLKGGQGFYGIEADLAAYGKIMGGGLPIGAVAGQSRFMDHIDGGSWRYGDESYPAVPMTFFASTFCKHPLVLRAARASLTRLKTEGAAIIERTSAMTARFVEQLNGVCAGHGVDLRVQRCASLFRLPQFKDVELLHYALIHRGLYIWEGRNCFLSEAHLEQDLNEAAGVFSQVVGELADEGFLGVEWRKGEPPSSRVVSTPSPASLAIQHEDVDAQAPTSSVPLSAEQEQLLALFHLGDPRWDAYNVCAAVETGATIDGMALRRAVDALVARHEALRARVAAVPGVTVQAFEPRCQVPVLVDHIAASALDQSLAAASAVRFDPYEAPSLRVHLFQLQGEARSVLLVVAHHLWVDGWSVAVVIEELLQLLSGTQALPPAFPFSSYLSAWRKKKASAAYASAAEQSARLLEGELPRPAFALPPDASCAANFAMHRFNAEETARVRQAAATHRLTLYQLMLGAYALAVQRVSGAERIRVAMALGGRDGFIDKPLVGYCSNICLVPLQAAADGSTKGYLDHTKKAVVEALGRSVYTYADLLNDAQRDHRHGATLPDLVFNLERRPETQAGTHGPLRWRAVPPRHVAFPQFVNVVDEGDALVVGVDHRSGIPAQAVLDVFADILTGLCRHPDGGASVPDGQTGTGSDAPQRTCDSDAFAAGAGPTAVLQVQGQPWSGVTVGWLADFIKHALSHPTSLAAVDEHESICYGDLLARALGVTESLSAAGVRPGAGVGICLRPGVSLLSALLGIAFAGAHYVPLDPAYPPQRTADCMADAGVALVVTDTESAISLPSGVARFDMVACRPVDRSAMADRCRSLPSLAPNALAYVIHTSGSTGRPKGVAIEHRSLTAFLRDLRRRWAIGAEDRILQVTSICFDIAGLELFLPLVSGGACVIASQGTRLDGTALAGLIDSMRVTVVQATPSTWQMILGAGQPLTTVCLAGVGGEPPPKALFERLQAASIQAWNLYGPTEATIWASMWRVSPDSEIVLGDPLDGVEMLVLKEDGSPAAKGETGELFLGGTCLARGYWQRPGLTAERFVPHPLSAQGGRLYRTGDVVKLMPEGGLRFLNRADGQIKLRGYRIELGEIEHEAQSHPDVAQAVCTFHPDSGDGGHMALHVQVRQGAAIDEAALRRHLATRLPPYMLPAAVRLMSSLPRTLNGKVDRKALVAGSDSEAIVAVSSAPEPEAMPDVALASKMLEIWREALEAPSLAPDSDFFAWGGYSLRAARIIKECRQRLGVQLRYEDIVKHPTPSQLAAALQSARPQAPVSSADPSTDTQAAVPMTSAQPASTPVAQGLAPSSFIATANRPDIAPPTRRTQMWRHRAFLTAVAALHIPAVPIVWSYTLLARALPALKPTLRYAYPRFLARCLLKAAGASVSMSGLERLPRNERPILIVANHSSRFDGYLLLSELPFAFKSFGSDEDHITREGLSLFAWIERTFDLSFMHYKGDSERTQEEMTRAREFLCAGGKLLMFPEGGFGPGRVGHIGDACARLAFDADAIIVPVGIVNSPLLYESNGYRYAGADVQMQIGEPIDARRFTGTVRDMAELLRNTLQSLVDSPSSDAHLCSSIQQT